MDSMVVRGDLRMAGLVLRYSAWPTLNMQTVATHCWQMARIYARIFGPPERDVAYYIQNHDSAELIVGDAPFPVKRDNPDLKAAHDRIEPLALRDLGIELPEPTEREQARVKVCDLLEMMSFGMMEVEMGNALAVPVVERTREASLAFAIEKLPAEDVFSIKGYVASEWDHHRSVLGEALARVPQPAPSPGLVLAVAEALREGDKRFG